MIGDMVSTKVSVGFIVLLLMLKESFEWKSYEPI